MSPPRARAPTVTAPIGHDVEREPDRLMEVSFGEFLVTRGVLDRFQLFRALQLQDRLPGFRIGEAAVALGYAPTGTIERAYHSFTRLPTREIG